VGRGIALLFHDRGTRKGVSGQQHAPAALYPRERPGTHCMGGWVGPRAGLDRRKFSSPPGFDRGPSSPQSVTILTELQGPQNLNIPYIIFSEVYACSSLFLLSLHSQAQGIHIVSLLHVMFSELLNVSNRWLSEFFNRFNKVCTKNNRFVSITCRIHHVLVTYWIITKLKNEKTEALWM